MSAHTHTHTHKHVHTINPTVIENKKKQRLQPVERLQTNKQTNRQTNKQTEIVNTEGPIDFLGHFFLHFFIDWRSNILQELA